MSNHPFSLYITKKRTAANKIHHGAQPMLGRVYIIALPDYIVFSCEVGCQDEASEHI